VTERDAFGNPIGDSGPAVSPPPPPPPVTVPGTDMASQAWVSLACAIGGWMFIPFVLPIVAIVLARRARPHLPPGGARSATTAALWIAWANIVACVLFVAFFAIVIAVSWDTNDF